MDDVTPIALRYVDDADGLRTGVTITHRDGRLWLWLAEEDDNGDIHDTPLGDRPATDLGRVQIMALANALAVGDARIPAPLAQVIVGRPFVASDYACAGDGQSRLTWGPSIAEVLFGPIVMPDLGVQAIRWRP